MRKYAGCQCIVCQKLFQDNDDVVVCPDCGTPYHRNCYQSAGHCINEPLHAVGGSWQDMQNERRLKTGGVECPHCGFVNLPGAHVCSSCDLPLTGGDDENESDSGQNETETQNSGSFVFTSPDGQQHIFQASDPCCGMSPEYDMEGECLDDVAHFVQTNTLYYIPLFRRFRETDRKLSFNLPCILFPYFYFANRKMWLMAIVSGLVWLVCSIPDIFLNTVYLDMLQSSGMDQQTLDRFTAFLSANQQLFENLQTPLFFISIAFRVVLCLLGNYLYFRFVLKSVRRIRKAAPSLSVKKALLRSEGGTNAWNILGFCGITTVVMYILTYILFSLI